MHRSPPDPRQSGFTLAEALVVVGIIGVLASILLPSLGRVREQGRIAVCANNERRIFEAVVAYANDNDRYLPCPLFFAAGKNSANLAGTAAGEGASNNGGDRVAWSFMEWGGQVRLGIADFRVGSLVKYLGGDSDQRQRLVWCPSDPTDLAPSAATKIRPTDPLTGYRNFSYSFNSAIRPASWGALAGVDPYLTLRVSDIRNGEQKILLYEERASNTGGAAAQPDDGEFNMTEVPGPPKPEFKWAPPAWISGRHGAPGEGNQVRNPYQDLTQSGTAWRQKAKSNQLFFDGHVELMSVYEFFDPIPNADRTASRAGPTHWPLK